MSEVTIAIPQLCREHQLQIVQHLGIGEDGPWRVTIVVMNMLLFQAATENDMVWARCSLLPDGSRDHDDLSLVLAEIGCLACFQPGKLENALRITAQKGLTYIVALTKTSPLERAEEDKI